MILVGKITTIVFHRRFFSSRKFSFGGYKLVKIMTQHRSIMACPINGFRIEYTQAHIKPKPENKSQKLRKETKQWHAFDSLRISFSTHSTINTINYISHLKTSYPKLAFKSPLL